MLHSSDPMARYKTRSDEAPCLDAEICARQTQSNEAAESPVALIPTFQVFLCEIFHSYSSFLLFLSS